MQIRENSLSKTNGITKAKDEKLIQGLVQTLNQAIKNDVKILMDEYFAKKVQMERIGSYEGNNLVIVKRSKNKICTIPMQYTSILSTGELFPCCGDFKPIKLNQLTFESIFNNQYLKNLRYMLNAGMPIKACDICKNRY